MGIEGGLILTMLCYAVIALASLSIAVPQTLLLARLWRAVDGLTLFRLKNALVYGSLFLLALRTMAVWADFVLLDQRYLGPIERRWGSDLSVAVVVTVAVVFAAVLHWRTQHDVKP